MENNKHNQGGSNQGTKSNGTANTPGKTPQHGIGNTANETVKKTGETLNKPEGSVDKNHTDQPAKDKRDQQK